MCFCIWIGPVCTEIYRNLIWFERPILIQLVFIDRGKKWNFFVIDKWFIPIDNNSTAYAFASDDDDDDDDDNAR